MREILFRGKCNSYSDDLNGKWIYGQLVIRPDRDDGDDKYFICESGHRFIQCLSKMPCTYKVVPETVGQYTGLKDKNGKRIFEGDVVKIGEHDTMVNGLCRVIFDTVNHCWALERTPEHHYSYFSFSDLNGFADSSEVIGNIHDNKELLEVGRC